MLALPWVNHSADLQQIRPHIDGRGRVDEDFFDFVPGATYRMHASYGRAESALQRVPGLSDGCVRKLTGNRLDSDVFRGR